MQLAAARDAVKHGWPGAQRKMDAAKQAEIHAARELEEAMAAEEKVIGKEYPEAIAKQKHVKAELAKQRQHLTETEAGMKAYSMYMLAQENNPHPIYGEAFRKALLGLESIDGKMRLFLAYLKEKGELIQPRPKTREELEAEAAEELRLQQEERDREAAAQRDRDKTLFGRIADRLKSENENLVEARKFLKRPVFTGTPAHLVCDVNDKARSSDAPVKTFDQEVMDGLDDKMRFSETGQLSSSELAEYCSMKIRGEHDETYCLELGQVSLKEAKQSRFIGDLEAARTALARGTSAFTYAGPKGRQHLDEIEYQEKIVSRELEQLKKGIYCHQKAEEAMREGQLVVFRRYWNDAKSLYESCGAAARKPQHLPALLSWDDIIKKQESDLKMMSDAIAATAKALEDNDMVKAAQQVYFANTLIEVCGKAGVDLTGKAQQLKTKVLDTLVEQRMHHEALCISAVGSGAFSKASNSIVEIWKCCRLAAIVHGHVHHDAPEKQLVDAEKKQAKVMRSPVVSLNEELLGTKEQHQAVNIINQLDLLTWPGTEKAVLELKAKAAEALEHLSKARRHLEAAATEQSLTKVLSLQTFELDLAMRVHANDVVKMLLVKTGGDKVSPNDTLGAPVLPFMCTAAAANNTQALDLLISVGGDVNIIDKQQYTPVHHAVIAKAWDALSVLGKVVKTNPNKISADNKTPLHMAVAGVAQIDTSAASKLRRMTLATKAGAFNQTRSLLKKQSDMEPWVEGVRLLLSDFWKINPNVTAGKYELTPLHLAAEAYNANAIELLLKSSKTDPNAKDKRGRSPLISAIWEKHNISLFLENSRVSVNQAMPRSGWSPLHVCVIKDSLGCMQQLLSCDRVDVLVEDLQGFTPMHLALHSKSKAVQILLQSAIVQDSGGQHLVSLLSTAERFVANGDPAKRGFWLQVTPEMLGLLPLLLLELRMWELLHHTLCNISFASSVIETVGVDEAIAVFAAVSEEVSNHPGIQTDLRHDFFQYQALLERHAYEIRTNKTHFAQLALENQLWGVRSTQQAVAELTELVLDIRTSVLNRTKKDTAAFLECLEYKTDLEAINRLSLYQILPSKKGFDRAMAFITQLYDASSISALTELDSHFRNVMDAARPENPGKTSTNICTLMSVARNQDEVAALKVVMKSTIDITQVKSQICAALSSVVPNNEPHVLLRVLRVFVHLGNLVAIVALSKNPATCATSFAEGRLLKTMNAIVNSFRGASNDQRLKPAIEKLKILSITIIEPSVFVIMDLVPPWTTCKRFASKDEYAEQVLNDIRNSCNLQPNLLRVCKVSATWNHVIIELMHDDVNPSKSLARNRVMAERLKAMVDSPSTVLHKGVVTQHIAAVFIVEGHVVPRVEGEWQEFHVRVVGTSIAMHNEFKFLDQYILPAAATFGCLHNCYISWSFQHGDVPNYRVAPISQKAHHLELHSQETEILIGLVGDRFGTTDNSGDEATSVAASELQEKFLDCPDLREAFIFMRDLADLEHSGLPLDYTAALSDKNNSKTYELLRKLKSKLEKFNGRRTLHYEPKGSRFNLNLDFVLERVHASVKQWEVEKARLKKLKERGSKADGSQPDISFKVVIQVTENRMKEFMQTCARWIKVLNTEDKRGGVPSSVMEAVNAVKEFPIFADQPEPKMDLETPDVSEIFLAHGLYLDVSVDMFHVGLAIADSIKARSSTILPKPPFHSHIHEREVQEVMRVTCSADICIEDGSSLHQALKDLELATCPANVPRVRSEATVLRVKSSDNMGVERAPSTPAPVKKVVVLVTGGPGIGKSTALAVLSQRLLAARNRPDPARDVPNIQIFFKVTDKHNFAAVLRYLDFELAVQLKGQDALKVNAVHMGDWETQMSALKKQIMGMPATTSLIFLVDGFDVEHRLAFSDMLLTLVGERNVQCVMSAEMGASFPPNKIPGESVSTFELDGVSEVEQRQLLSSFGSIFSTRDLTDAEQKFVIGTSVASNPLYLHVYAMLCAIKPSWDVDDLELPENVAQLFELYVIPFISDWICIPAQIIEAVIEVAQMNPKGIRIESLQIEVQALVTPEHREWASMNSISMVVAHLVPILRPSRRVDGLIALGHNCLVESLSVCKALCKALHLSSSHLETHKQQRERVELVPEDLDPENVDPELLERLEAMFRHRVGLFNLRSTKPMFLAFSPGDDWALPRPENNQVDAAKDVHKDEQWAQQLSTNDRGEPDAEILHNLFVSSHSGLAMDPSESIVFVMDKWCDKVEKVLNAYDLHDNGMYLTKEGMFDAAYNHMLNVQKLSSSSDEHEFVLAGIGLEMAACIWNEKNGEDEIDKMCDMVSTCLMRFRDLKTRIVKEHKLLEQRCDALSEQLVHAYLDAWKRKKLNLNNINEVLVQQIYSLVADFRGQIEILHSRAQSQMSAGGEMSPWHRMSPALIRSACEGLHVRLQAEANRITDMMARKREAKYNEALMKLQNCLEAQRLHEALDCYHIARDCGRYAAEVIDNVDPNNREEGLKTLWNLKSQLDKACDTLIASGQASVAFGPAFVEEDSLVGIPTFLIIQAKNAKGEPLKKGGEGDGWEIEILDDLGAVRSSLKDNEDGTYDVEFVPRFERGCKISIAFRAGKMSQPVPLKGSPFFLKFGRTSFWSQKSVTTLPTAFPQRMVFIASSDVAMLLDVKNRLIYSLSPDTEEASHTHIWKCQKHRLREEDFVDEIKGAFPLSGRNFLAYTESLSQSYVGFSSSMFLLEMQEDFKCSCKSLVATEQEIPQEIIDEFGTLDWKWSSLSCRTENKVEGIPESIGQHRVPGSKWVVIGSEKPQTGEEIANEALAVALQEKSEFSEEELSKFEVLNLVHGSYIKVGDKYFQTTDQCAQEASVGVKWEDIGPKQPQGSEIVNEALAAALQEKVEIFEQKRAQKLTRRNSRLAFFHFSSKQEMGSFEPSNLPPDSYIKVGKTFFRPVWHSWAQASQKRETPTLDRITSVQNSFAVSGLQQAPSKKSYVMDSSNRYEDFSLPIVIVSVDEDSRKKAPVAFLMTHWSESSRAWLKRRSAIYCAGKLVVFGGCDGKSKVITSYQPEDMEKEKAPLKYETVQPSGHVPCMRCNYFMEYNGKHIVLHGGIDVDENCLNDVYAYDLENERWDQLLSLEIPCPFPALYAASPNYVLALYTRSGCVRMNALDLKNIKSKSSVQICGHCIMQTLSKVRRSIRSNSSDLHLEDSWSLRACVYRALNDTDLTAILGNVNDMARHLTALQEKHGVDLTEMKEDLQYTHQLHADMLKRAGGLQTKLTKIPAHEAPYGAIEKCYLLRAKYLIQDNLTLQADFANISKGHTAATKAINKSKCQLEAMRTDWSTFKKQTNFFGVDPGASQYPHFLSNPLASDQENLFTAHSITLRCFELAWDMYEDFLTWASAPLDEPRFKETSFVQKMQEQLQEFSKTCATFGKSDIFSTICEYLKDSIELNRFNELIKMEYGKPAESWRAIRILCAMSSKVLNPPTWATVLQSKVMKDPSISTFMQSAASDYDAAMVDVSGRILRLSVQMKAGVDGVAVAHKSMYSRTCFCTVTNVRKRPLSSRSAISYISKPTRQELDPAARKIIGKARMGKTKDFKELAEKDAELYSRAVDAHGNNLLHVAASNGQKKIVKEIMRNKDKLDLFARNDQGKNALDLALEFKYHDVAQYLAEKLPALAEPHEQAQAQQSVTKYKLHGIRVDFTLHGTYPGEWAQAGASAYLRFGHDASFVSYVPTKIKSTSSGRSQGDPAHVTAWFIVGAETGPWSFAYGSSFTEISLQRSADGPLATESKSEFLEHMPLHVNLGGEEASSSVKQAALACGLNEDSVRYSRSELMAEFASYSRRMSDLELVAHRSFEEDFAAERQLRANALVSRDLMNRPVIMDGVVRGLGLHTICTPHYRDALGRIVVSDGLVRNVDVEREAERQQQRLEADWRSMFSIPVMDLTEIFEDGLEGKIDIQAVGLGPLSPATKKDLETLAEIGSETLQSLPEEASLEDLLTWCERLVVHTIESAHHALVNAGEGDVV
jgi:ankyrin repeat protein